MTTTISNVNVAALKSRQPLPGRPDQRHQLDLGRASLDDRCERQHRAVVDHARCERRRWRSPPRRRRKPATSTSSTTPTPSRRVRPGSNPSVGNNFDVTGGALFQIGPTVNFANQINVNITSLDLTTLGRDYSMTGNKGLSSLKTGGTDSLDKADLSDAASIVDQAISQVATLRGKLGAIQKNAIDSNIRSLQTSLEQVTSAESSIRDADFAVETAALTRSQILGASRYERVGLGQPKLRKTCCRCSAGKSSATTRGFKRDRRGGLLLAYRFFIPRAVDYDDNE